MSADDTHEVMLLLGVFAAHNLEEIAHLPQDLETLPSWIKKAGPWRDVRSFTVATSLLTAAVGAGFGDGLRSRGLSRAVLLGGSAAALMGNAASHLGRALIQHRYAGGLATAPVMGLLAARVLSSSTRSLSTAARRRILLVGNMTALPAIVGSLALGRFLTRNERRQEGYDRPCTSG